MKMFVAAGGLAADYIAWEDGILQSSGIKIPSEDKFVALAHDFPSTDFRSFFGLELSWLFDPNNEMHIYSTMIFANFAKYAVVPLLRLNAENM